MGWLGTRWLGKTLQPWWDSLSRTQRVLLVAAVAGFSAFGVTLYAWQRERTLLQAKLDEYASQPPTVITFPPVVLRDTVIIHDSLPTETDTTGTRTAVFLDSTFAGVISGTVTAPPTGALGIQYTFTRPAFTPTLTLTQDSAIIDWRGERSVTPFQRPAPIMVPIPVRDLPFIGPTYSVGVSPLLIHYRFTAGIALRPTSNWSIIAEFEQRVDLGDPLGGPRLYLGVRWDR